MAYTGFMDGFKKTLLPILPRPGAMAGIMASLLLALPVAATTVYKTVDENGVVTFSDSAPAGSAAVETLDIDVAEPQLDENEQQRLEAMRETTDRMAADRMAREKHRAELRRLQAEQQVVETGYPATQPEYNSYYYPTSVISSRYRRHDRGRFGVYYRGDNWGGYYGDRPRPEHPIARPPLRPGHGKPYRPEPRQQPVYNEYPASLVRKGYDPRVRRVIETGHYPERR